jgi:2-succinyl-5-enolpyruvyl-6-hydroxy-3-cyclohexene-1-carboxylate synthase
VNPLDPHVLLRAFVDELARSGLAAACTSPGSRSTPLVLALARDSRIQTWSHIDERDAAFFAVGLAKASGRPVAIACTSGTAAAEYAPAVHEAHEARVPLLVLTADRPAELRDAGAGQTIDQLKLYGTAVKWFVEVDAGEATPQRLRWIRTLACRAYWATQSGRAGPVHLNFPLREPLVVSEPLPPDDSARPDGQPWLARPAVHATMAPSTRDALASEVLRRPCGVIVAGRHERDDGTADAVVALAELAGLPVLADPLSGARRGPAAVAHYDALLRDEAFADAYRPDLVIRVGDLPTSRPLRNWLDNMPDALQVAFEPEGAWQDPAPAVATAIAADPAPALHALADVLRARGAQPPGGEPAEQAGAADWLAAWRAADDAAARAIVDALADGLSEPRVAVELGVRLPAEATLFVASSMPIRDVETFFAVRDRAPRVLSNRGANGIDGTVAAAYGAAAAGTGPVVLLIGDVALAHDVGALLAGPRLGLDLTVILLNNDGGGIFNFLPVAGEADAFEQHVATPPGLDVRRLAEACGARHRSAQDADGLAQALDAELASPGTGIIEVTGDREVNVAVHRAIWKAVSAALAQVTGSARGTI